jgi:hypothetical protein
MITQHGTVKTYRLISKEIWYLYLGLMWVVVAGEVNQFLNNYLGH